MGRVEDLLFVAIRLAPDQFGNVVNQAFSPSTLSHPVSPQQEAAGNNVDTYIDYS